MTMLTHHSGAQVARIAEDRVAVTGNLAQIGVFLDEIRANGLRVVASDPMPAGGGVFLVNVRSKAAPTPPPAPRPVWQPWYRSRRIVAWVVGIALALCLAGTTGLYLATQVVGLPALAGLAVAAVLVLAGLRRLFGGQRTARFEGTFQGTVRR